jgi:hypothetical protein
VADTQGHHPTQLLSHCITRWDTRLPHPKYPEVFQRVAYVVYTEEEAQNVVYKLIMTTATALVTNRLHSWSMAPRGLGQMQ